MFKTMYHLVDSSPELARALAWIYAFFSFALGASVASFLNVVVWRVPRGESIVSPPSHCPKCGASIRWWQNIPILSYLALRGKCANCRAPISPRYILVELLGGCLFLAAFLHIFGGDVPTHFGNLDAAREPIAAVWMLLLWWIWISLMIVGSFIDFDHQLLPDFVTVGGMALGVLNWTLISLSFRNWHPDFANLRMYFPLVWSLAGLAFGFGLLWLVRWLGSKAFKREAMGMGDVFLMGAVGAIFGPVAVLFTLMTSCVIGSLVGVAMIMASKAKLGKFVAIPYGPYISMGSLLWMFYGPQIVNWYLDLLSAG